MLGDPGLGQFLVGRVELKVRVVEELRELPHTELRGQFVELLTVMAEHGMVEIVDGLVLRFSQHPYRVAHASSPLSVASWPRVTTGKNSSLMRPCRVHL